MWAHSCGGFKKLHKGSGVWPGSEDAHGPTAQLDSQLGAEQASPDRQGPCCHGEIAIKYTKLQIVTNTRKKVQEFMEGLSRKAFGSS